MDATLSLEFALETKLSLVPYQSSESIDIPWYLSSYIWCQNICFLGRPWYVVSILETNVVVHLLEAAIKQMPFGVCVTSLTSGSWQTLEFIWDSQIEPFIELNMGLHTIDRFWADFVRAVTDITAS